MRIELRKMERLSFRERQVVVLKEMGYPTEIIAKKLGLSPSTVTTLLHRARQKGYEVVVILPGQVLLPVEGEEEDEEARGEEG
ncbi:RNA polymerase sigma factor [Ammonifex thiophilus]|uniref:Sigma-70 family RNA polymerase sigma factor n=1 Tax=Ammonifex thiophilus TaxID=444093 RepID=A0A3D8P829_9THEO|nr:sigma-70 region 4 domain-containing protein [Ammonifex thiophilus]RDV84651.1 sigma-70 family RNA polymerase sigma factor [Ammonifex thiophilus]